MKRFKILLASSILLFVIIGSVYAYKCFRCQDTGIADCSLCRGTGERGSCVVCDGTGIKYSDCFSCGGSGRSSIGRCYSCGGKGFKTERCYSCRGTGSYKCSACNGRGTVKCSCKRY